MTLRNFHMKISSSTNPKKYEKVNHQPVSHQSAESFSCRSFLTETLSRCLFAGQILNRTQVEIKFLMSSAAAEKKKHWGCHQRFYCTSTKIFSDPKKERVVLAAGIKRLLNASQRRRSWFLKKLPCTCCQEDETVQVRH